MGEWTKLDAAEGTASLPQFSAYPLHYVSALGEYLMMVPQLLEALVSTQPETDEQIFDQEQEMASTLLSKVTLCHRHETRRVRWFRSLSAVLSCMGMRSWA